LAKSRTRIALILALIIMLSLRFAALAWVLPLFVLITGVAAAREMHMMALQKNVRSSLAVTLSATAIFILAGWAMGPHDFIRWILPFIVVLLLAVFCVKVFLARLDNALLAIPMNVFIPLYVGLPLALGLQVLQIDRMYFLLVLMSIWMLDSAAFFVGSRFGRHKMSPEISPKKSWEGAAGGFAGCILIGIIFKIGMDALGADLGLTWGEIIFVGALIGVLGQAGDLAESLIKRDAGVKDSGVAFGGHGGVLDRMDSVLFSFAAFYVFLAFAEKLPVIITSTPF
jgi:phosphatidate cytidylyltransferase